MSTVEMGHSMRTLFWGTTYGKALSPYTWQEGRAEWDSDSHVQWQPALLTGMCC